MLFGGGSSSNHQYYMLTMLGEGCFGYTRPLTGGHLCCSQEPRSKEGSDYFDSRSDGLNVDVQGPFPASASLWSGGSAQLLPQRSESAHAIGSDPLRQNIYENFMRELEISRTNTENIETSTETAESSSESLSSLEQLDLLFEKEQGVVRKAGWLFFKPLVTLQKERKLELVARRKWRQYWVTLKGKCTADSLRAPGFIPPLSSFLRDVASPVLIRVNVKGVDTESSGILYYKHFLKPV